MKKAAYLLIFLLCPMVGIYGMKSAETKGEQPIFFGTLTTQEDNTFYITNITIAKSALEQGNIQLFEKPKDMTPVENFYILPGNPYKDLSTTMLELQKVKKIEVPDPGTIWKWTNSEPQRLTKTTVEFIEILVTWRTGTTTAQLLELGPENSRQQVKLFCDVIDSQIPEMKGNGALLCPGIKKSEVRKKGAPFQSIKIVEIEEPCYKIPADAGTIKNDDNN